MVELGVKNPPARFPAWYVSVNYLNDHPPHIGRASYKKKCFECTPLFAILGNP